MSGRNEVRAFLGLGGNLGDPLAAMAAALRLIDADGSTRVVTVSSVYRTPPWGAVAQPDFLNCVAELRTTLYPRALLELCLGAERELKRVRTIPGGPRVIDVDVLCHGATTLCEDGLELPHPRMLQRAFVLIPLREIAPDLTLDGFGVEHYLDRVDAGGISVVETGDDWWRG